MAITFIAGGSADNTGVDTNTLTVTGLDVSNGSDRFVLVGACTSTGGAQEVTNATYGATSLTEYFLYTNSIPTGNSTGLHIWGGTVSETDSNTLTVDTAGSINGEFTIVAATFAGVSDWGTNTPASVLSNAFAAGSIQTNLTSDVTNRGVSFIVSRNPSANPAPQALDSTNTEAATATVTGGAGHTASLGYMDNGYASLDMGWSGLVPSSDTTFIVTDLAPATPPPPVTNVAIVGMG